MAGIYKHLKLDKFVGGQQQRIFKTETNITQVVNNKNIINRNNNVKNVYYGNYKSDIQTDQLQSNLIDFHQINFDYLYNRPDKLNVTTIYNDRYNPSFATSANVIKNYSTEQDNQRISYFPQYIYTPIDICKYNNSYYMLLPISTNRFINIAHPDDILNNMEQLKDKPFGKWLSFNTYDKVPFKQKYTEMISSFYQKPAYTSQDNNIPIYDLQLKNIQTIKFESSEQVFNWILKWELQNIIYIKDGKYVSLLNEILYDSTNQKFYNDDPTMLDNCDSICLPPLVEYLINKRYLYGSDTVIKIISDLLSNMNKKSLIRYFNPIGKISEINQTLLSSCLLSSSNLYNDLKNNNIYNIKRLLTQKQDVVFGNQCLPENSIIVGNSIYPLYNNQNKFEYPSCYVNLLHLKNTRDPEYQINYQITQDIQGVDYDITSCGYISSKIDNSSLYEFDGRYTIQFNNQSLSTANLTTNKYVTEDILNFAISSDNYIASINSGYSKLFPQRLAVKEIYYTDQYNNKNVTHNINYKLGQLDGFRNYLYSGVNYNNLSWLSYHYNCSTNNNLFNNNYITPFTSYSLNRQTKWITDRYNNNLSTTIMKDTDQECPWTKQLQQFMGCTLSTSQRCNGFCTYPCNGKQRSMNSLGETNGICGYTWNSKNYFNETENYFDDTTSLCNGIENLTNHEYYIIPSSSFDREIYAYNDISVNDDIQIFFVSGLYNDTSFKNIINSITEQKQFYSIFNGFGKSSLHPESGIIYPEFLYRNQYNSNQYQIAENSNFNGPHIITKNTQLLGYNLNTNQKYCSVLSAGEFMLIKVKSWWSDIVQCDGTIQTKSLNSNSEQIEKSQQILYALHNYQYIETLDGFYKFKQRGLHKSNIYSINLANTGLNPQNDKQMTYLTKTQVIDILQKKYFIRYYSDQDNFLIATDQNIFIFTRYYSHHNDNKFCKTPLFKNLYQKYKLSNLTNLSGFILDLRTIPFNDMIQIQGLKTYFNQDTNQTLYYYPYMMEQIQSYNQIREDIRNLIQLAIYKSITKYMPADTNIWKIKYSGK